MEYSNIRQIIFEFGRLMLTNVFVFVFSPEVDPEYTRIRIRVEKNILNIFVFIFGPPKKIRFYFYFLKRSLREDMN